MTNSTMKSNREHVAESPEILAVQVIFRLSERAYRELQALAATEGLGVSPFVRRNIYKLLAQSHSANAGQ